MLSDKKDRSPRGSVRQQPLPVRHGTRCSHARAQEAGQTESGRARKRAKKVAPSDRQLHRSSVGGCGLVRQAEQSVLARQQDRQSGTKDIRGCGGGHGMTESPPRPASAWKKRDKGWPSFD